MVFLSIGTMVPKNYETEITALSNAANRFLWNFTDALCSADNKIIRLSYLGIPIEESLKKELMKEKGDLNYIWRTKRFWGGIWNCHRALKNRMKEVDCFLAYNVVYAWLFGPEIAHKMNKKAILLLADFSPSEAYTKLWRKLYARLQLYFIRRYDMVIGLSERTSRYLNSRQKFICIEGGIDREVYDFFAPDSSREDCHLGKRYMYAGTLEAVTGIDILLEAFTQLKEKDIRLYISGKGSYESLVRQAAIKDERIIFLGCIPYLEYLNELKNADVLVNPRNMNLPENDNNFPSKIMEYLAAGKTIVSTRFPGWERFSDYIFFTESSVTEIKDCMLKAASDDSQIRNKRNRQLAEKFIWENQIKKITRKLEETNYASSDRS